jgi:hypothetical protein
MFLRYAGGLRSHLKHPLDREGCRRLLEDQMSQRQENFLRILEQGVYSNRASPYRRLLEHASVELGDVRAMVADAGVQGALERLYDSGVYVTVEEVRGRQPVSRPGLEFPTEPHDFDNPWLAGRYQARSGGSRSAGRRTLVDLDGIGSENAHWPIFDEAFGLTHAPAAIWVPAPPGYGGLWNVLAHARRGKRIERWFSHSPVNRSPAGLRDRLVTRTTALAGGWWGPGIPMPEHVPADDPGPVARWLADLARAGAPALLVTYPSSAVRVCGAASNLGLDISGTFFMVGGEPLTSDKVAAVAAVGARVVCNYSMVELGMVGSPCAAPVAADDVHLLDFRVGVVQRSLAVGGDGSQVGAMFLTSLLPTAPKLMLNIDSGDYGVIDERDCGCPFAQLGLTRHLRDIRSHEKLTTEGVTFLGSDVVDLVERTLPQRFGGQPGDYQLVDRQGAEPPRVDVVVSPRVGDVDGAEVIEAVLAHLGSKSGAQRMMAGVWRSGGTLDVVRRQPQVTSGGKVLALHVAPGVGV